MLVKRVGSAVVLIVAGAFFTNAQAAPISGGEATKRSMADFSEVEKAQIYIYGGRRYCFYWDAWNGPGWYRCGYHWREGFGWGGGPGWHGWSYRQRGHRGPRYTNRRGRDWDGRRGGRHEGRRDGRSGRDRGSAGRSGRSDGAPGITGRGGRSDSGRGASSGRSSGGGGQGFSGGRGGSSSPGGSGRSR